MPGKKRRQFVELLVCIITIPCVDGHGLRLFASFLCDKVMQAGVVSFWQDRITALFIMDVLRIQYVES